MRSWFQTTRTYINMKSVEPYLSRSKRFLYVLKAKCHFRLQKYCFFVSFHIDKSRQMDLNDKKTPFLENNLVRKRIF